MDGVRVGVAPPEAAPMVVVAPAVLRVCGRRVGRRDAYCSRTHREDGVSGRGMRCRMWAREFRRRGPRVPGPAGIRVVVRIQGGIRVAVRGATPAVEAEVLCT